MTCGKKQSHWPFSFCRKNTFSVLWLQSVCGQRAAANIVLPQETCATLARRVNNKKPTNGISQFCLFPSVPKTFSLLRIATKEQNLPNVSTLMLTLLGSVNAGCSTTQVTVLSLFIIRGKWSTLTELCVPLGWIALVVFVEKMSSLGRAPAISHLITASGLAPEVEQVTAW